MGVIKAAMADRATSTTKGTGLKSSKAEDSIAIGIIIAAAVLFEMKFVSVSENRLSRRNTTIGKKNGLRMEAMKLLIFPAAPDAIMASPSKIPPPTRKINSH